MRAGRSLRTDPAVSPVVARVALGAGRSRGSIGARGPVGALRPVDPLRTVSPVVARVALRPGRARQPLRAGRSLRTRVPGIAFRPRGAVLSGGSGESDGPPRAGDARGPLRPDRSVVAVRSRIALRTGGPLRPDRSVFAVRSRIALRTGRPRCA